MDTVQIYDLAIQIEQKVSQLYARFSTLFRNDLQASRFWTQLSYHEKAHAEALMRGKGSLLGAGSVVTENGKSRTSPSVNSSELEAVFEKVREHERTIRKEKPTLQEALTMMMEIENGEIHQIYSRLVQPSGTVQTGRSDASPSPREHALMIKDFLSRTPAGTSLLPQGVPLLGMAGSVPEPPPTPRKPEGV
ncbi:MAG: hypothetical protein HY760_06265, partial [Nitrospirae bacterium]|nr:hypothetical protein [Nitrospirota bacterium]